MFVIYVPVTTFLHKNAGASYLVMFTLKVSPSTVAIDQERIKDPGPFSTTVKSDGGAIKRYAIILLHCDYRKSF